MGDTTNLTVHVKGVHVDDREAIDRIVLDGRTDDFGGNGWDSMSDDASVAGSIAYERRFGMHDVSTGQVAEVYNTILAFMQGREADVDEDGYERSPYDFAVLAYQDPIFDALGWLFCCVPGLGEALEMECDQQGQPVAFSHTVTDPAKRATWLAEAAIVEAFEVYPNAPAEPVSDEPAAVSVSKLDIEKAIRLLAEYDEASDEWSALCDEENGSGDAPSVKDCEGYSGRLEELAHGFADLLRQFVAVQS